MLVLRLKRMNFLWISGDVNHKWADSSLLRLVMLKRPMLNIGWRNHYLLMFCDLRCPLPYMHLTSAQLDLFLGDLTATVDARCMLERLEGSTDFYEVGWEK